MTILDAATPMPVSPDPFASLGAGREVFRQHDWSSSPLGPPEAWPCALRDALRLVLASPQPTWLGWGQGPDDLVFLYNDAYRPVLGGRHPAALGRPLSEAMPEIWSGIRDAALPFFDEARRSPEGVTVDSRRFILERGDLPEEAYLSLSLIPLTDDEGRVQGLLCPALDETRRIVGERQLATVAELAERTAGLQTGPALSDAVVAALSTNPWDLPFAILFIKGPKSFEACHAVGIDPCHAAAAPERWPLAEALASPRPLPIHDLADRLGTDLPTGPGTSPRARRISCPCALPSRRRRPPSSPWR